MKLTNLLESPVYIEDTLYLIEKAFEYSDENKFSIDFFPLMQKENHKNCHILIVDNKVVAHIGVLQKHFNIRGTLHSIAMYGGIAVAEEERGKGFFKKIFSDVIEKNKDVALHLLWSDQLDLYENFGFAPAIEQFEYHQDLEDALDFEPASLQDLSEKEIKTLSEIYNKQIDLRIERNLKDWEVLKGITSTQLYLKKENGVIKNYFFMNKGEDLNGVIIEVGSFTDYEMIKNFGILWAPIPLDSTYETLYAAVIRQGNDQLFKDFIHDYTDNFLQIASSKENKVFFSFEENSFELDFSEFITGVLGPNSFEELDFCKPIYISGLDSI